MGKLTETKNTKSPNESLVSKEGVQIAILFLGFWGISAVVLLVAALNL